MLAGASSKSSIIFWDLLKMKERSCFNESFSDEVTSVDFSKNVPTTIIGASLDGMISLFDLTKDNEEDSVEFVMRMD
jgi:WD40 repeat protein